MTGPRKSTKHVWKQTHADPSKNDVAHPTKSKKVIQISVTAGNVHKRQN
jgi:hypothetical protein